MRKIVPLRASAASLAAWKSFIAAVESCLVFNFTGLFTIDFVISKNRKKQKETVRNRKKEKETERNSKKQKETERNNKFYVIYKSHICVGPKAVLRSSVRSHATHAIGELKNNRYS